MRKVLLLLLVLYGCAAVKELPVESVTDSVSVIIRESVIYKDSLIYVEVPAESHEHSVEDTEVSHLETSLAISEAWVSKGKLNHTIEHKQNALLPKIVNIPTYIKTEETKSIGKQVIVKEVEKELNKWQLIRMTIGSIVMIVFVMWLAFKVAKRLVC